VGLTIRGHILGKDGIFAAALIVEMLARTGQRISQLRERVYSLIGRLYSVEVNLPATSEMRIIIPRRMQQAPPESIASYPVLRVSDLDGTKFYLENDHWALVRFSGTEPALRLHAEADSPEMAQELVEWLQEHIQVDRQAGRLP
jgi:phosphomannomutase